jgi:hypothetical protein
LYETVAIGILCFGSGAMVDLSSATTLGGVLGQSLPDQQHDDALAPIGSLFERSRAKGTDPPLECKGSAVIGGHRRPLDPNAGQGNKPTDA